MPEFDEQQSATQPEPLHPVHRHDVGRTRARDRTALDDRRYRDEADSVVRDAAAPAIASDDEEQQFGESTNARRVRTPPAVPPRVESNLSAAAGAAAPTEQAEGAGS
jgi:hypothetical protein